MGRLKQNEKDSIRYPLLAVCVSVLICLVSFQSATANTGSSSCAYRQILVSYYADPFKIDISSMKRANELMIDDPANGIDWEKIYLPYPCVNADNKRTY
ncbi:MAG: hypothetical protein QXF20_04895, partial [Candidatus Hadarchaeales archaeon]